MKMALTVSDTTDSMLSVKTGHGKRPCVPL